MRIRQNDFSNILIRTSREDGISLQGAFTSRDFFLNITIVPITADELQEISCGTNVKHASGK